MDTFLEASPKRAGTYRDSLGKRAANYVPLSPLSFLPAGDVPREGTPAAHLESYLMTRPKSYWIGMLTLDPAIQAAVN